MDNLDLWNKLGRTDPNHTKAFNRAGGFKGTAIKPIYTEQKMTEIFGPCGVGWGFDEPRFTTVPGSEGQVAVYCHLSLWFNYEGKVSAPVFGVGGDMVVVKQSNGLRTDDEAFKKAFTDAIGNAMKHIGMSADVHMGLFDDSKYGNSVRAELNGEPALGAGLPPKNPTPHTPQGNGEFSPPQPKAATREVFTRMMDGLRKNGNLGKDQLRKYWTGPAFQEAFQTLPKDWRVEIEEEKNAFIASYEKKPGGRTYKDPEDSLNQQFAATIGEPT